jgi:hypothetical protein
MWASKSRCRSWDIVLASHGLVEPVIVAFVHDAHPRIDDSSVAADFGKGGTILVHKARLLGTLG